MNPTRIRLLRGSFAQVQPIAREAAALFYANLFEADPGLRPLFRGGLSARAPWVCFSATGA